MTAVWCRLCRRDHILPTCAECRCDLANGHILVKICDSCKSADRERRKIVERHGNSTDGKSKQYDHARRALNPPTRKKDVDDSISHASTHPVLAPPMDARFEKMEKEAALPGGGISPEVLAMASRAERDVHERNQHPVGMFLDLVDYDKRPTAEQLMLVAEVGHNLLYAALGHPDATEGFLEEARETWGPLVDAGLQEMS
jgi:hypothetical protein